MNIYKNFINKEKSNEINTVMLSGHFPWFYRPHQIDKDSSYFFHCFYKNNKINSDFYSLLKPILDKLNPTKLLHIRANLCLKRPMKSQWHCDEWTDNLKHKTAIYYVNTNNGYTMFKDKKIKSEKNKIVIFDASLTHKARYQTDRDIRMVINFNYNV